MTKKLDQPNSKILLRLPPDELAAIQKAATFEERSVNQWCRLVLKKMADRINRLPPEAD